MQEITQLSKHLGRLNEKINDLAGVSCVTVFFDPDDGDPFGFAFEYGLGNAGSVSFTRSRYWKL
jgi:hypothetical protein